MISHYPDGVPGAALLLMRLSSASIAFPSLARLWPAPASWWLVAIPAAVLALSLVVGFGTRATALLLVAALAGGLLNARGEAAVLLLACAGSAGALALLGAGAFSFDAHWFGRRVIRLEPRSPDRGSAS